MTKVNLPQELLEFYEELESLTQQISQKVILKEIELTDALLKEHVSQGAPLFSLVPIDIDPGLCREAFEKICTLLEAKRPQTAEQLKELKGLKEEEVVELVREFVMGEEEAIAKLVVDKQLSRMTVEFALENTAKPFLIAYAKLVGPYTKDDAWQKNYCPVCGNKAKYGKLNAEDNKRHLQCNLCDHQWLFKRVACPNCANEDHNSLRTLLIDETPAYQIHVCEQCKTYLKVFDSRQAARGNSALNDAKTIFLDIIAQQKGYTGNSFAS